ncbi:MAG: hypothetical protein ACE5I7_05240, partial [Candidatus Binatia bacterium]
MRGIFRFRACFTYAALFCLVLSQASLALRPGDGDTSGWDSQDVAGVLACMFERDGAALDCAAADANGDGVVSLADLIALLQLVRPPVTPVPRPGPRISFFGLAAADGTVITPVSIDAEGAALFRRPVGTGFQLVVEAMPGKNGLQVGTSVFNTAFGDPSVRPDLQIEASQALGDGDRDVCGIGGVPGFSPADFSFTQEIADALNDFSCAFNVATGPKSACTVDTFGTAKFVSSGSRIVQFCLVVTRNTNLRRGDTLLTVQVRDVEGNVGPQARAIVRIGGAPLATVTSTRRATATRPSSPTPTFSVTSTATSTRTLTQRPTATPTSSATRRPTAVGTRTPTARSTPTRTKRATPTRRATFTPTARRTPTRVPSPTGTQA